MKDWFPNWQEENEYPPNGTPNKIWAWEFLRRNTFYQNDYESLALHLLDIGYYENEKILGSKNYSAGENPQSEEVFLQGLDAIQKIIKKYSVVAFSSDFLPDPSLPGEKQDFQFIGGGEIRVYDRARYWINDEKLSSSPLRKNCIPQIIKLMDQDKYKKNDEKELTTKIRQRELVVSISLDANIKEQIELIRKLALAQKKQLSEWGIYKDPRSRPSDFRRYLQILDALNSGIKDEAIGEKFWPKDTEGLNRARTRKGENSVRRAKKLRDYDYLRIAQKTVV